jgi:hypothetical protein
MTLAKQQIPDFSEMADVSRFRGATVMPPGKRKPLPEMATAPC